MTIIWSIATIAALFGAIAGAVLEGAPYTAVAFGLMAIAFAIAAYQSLSKK
jgi:hypothetical protein